MYTLLPGNSQVTATIPGKVFNECIEPYLRGRTYGWLGKRCNLKEDSIEKALKRENIDFDLCDLILCRLNAVNLWWVEPLDEFYWTVDLT